MAGVAKTPELNGPFASRRDIAGFFRGKDIPMIHDRPMILPQRVDHGDMPGQGQDPHQPILRELIAALKPHPRGLRRWSVMRAIRVARHRGSRDIPLKFEADVESVFRKFSADAIDAHARVCTVENAPFCRPHNTAGEVWALRPGKAAALLGEGVPPDVHTQKDNT